MKTSAADGSRVLIGYEDGSVALWDCRNYKNALSRQNIYADPVMCLDFDPVSQTGFAGSVDDQVSSWKLESDTITPKNTVRVTNPGFNSCAVRGDGRLVAFAGWDSNVRLFSVKTLKPLAVLGYHKDSVYCAAFSEDKLLACGSKDQQISLWDIYR